MQSQASYYEKFQYEDLKIRINRIDQACARRALFVRLFNVVGD